MKKNYQALSGLNVDALELPDHVVDPLEAHNFISAFDVFGLTLLRELEGIARGSCEGVLVALPKFVAFVSEKPSPEETRRTETRFHVIHAADVLQLRTDKLNLTPRGKAIIRRLRLITLDDLLRYGLTNLKKFKNVGERTCRNMEKAVLELIASQALTCQGDLGVFLEGILPKSVDRRDIIKARFGFHDGKGQTLRKIGQDFGLSAERIRQILVDELQGMTVGRAGVAMNILKRKVDSIVARKGDLSLEDVIRQKFFRRHRKEEVLFALNLLCALFPEKYGAAAGRDMSCKH